MERLVDEQVAAVVDDIEKAITKQINAAANAVIDNTDLVGAIDSQPIDDVYKKAWAAAALSFAGKIYNAIDASQKQYTDAQYESWEASINTYLSEQGGKKVVLINNYTKEWVQTFVTSVMQQAAEEGLGTDDIAKLLRARWGDLSRNRALRIAQTEMNAAANFGAKEAAIASGMTRKYWIPARDDKVRPEHLQAGNAEPIGIEEKFNIGGYSMDRPSDPDGPAMHVINCRCQMGFLP